MKCTIQLIDSSKNDLNARRNTFCITFGTIKSTKGEIMKARFKKSFGKAVTSGSLVCLVSLFLFFTVSVSYGSGEPVELKFAISEGTQAARTVYGHQKWAEAVEKASNGSVKMSMFPSNSLISAKQMFDGTLNGLADVACISIGHYPGRFPMTEALSFPGNGITNPKMAGDVIMAMYKKYPEMQKEFKDVQVLFFFGFAPMSIASVEKPVRSWADLDGMRLRINTKETAEYLKSGGVAPAFIAPADIFLSMEKGLLEGSVMGWFGHHAFGVTKLAKYFTETPAIPGPFFAYIMNKRKFDSLTEEQKAAVMSVSGDAGASMMAESGYKEIEVSTKSIRENPAQEIIQLNDEEQGVWEQKAVESQLEIIKKLEKRGLPIKSLIQDVKDMVAKDKANN